MRVAIFNYESPESLRVRKLLLNRLEEETAITYDDQQPDVVITIGGDGTRIACRRFVLLVFILDTWVFIPIGVILRSRIWSKVCKTTVVNPSAIHCWK